MQKNTVLTIGLLSLAGLGLTTADAAVKMVLDGSSPSALAPDTTYKLLEDTVEVTSSRPVLCNAVNNYEAADTQNPAHKLKVYDPNLEMLGFPVNNIDGIYLGSFNYLLNNATLKIDTEDTTKAQCVSAERGGYDLIFKDPFEPVSIPLPKIEYVGLPETVDKGQEINYQIKMKNTSQSQIKFDLMEYWNKNPDLGAWISSYDTERTCNNGGPVTCLLDNRSEGVTKNIILAANETLMVDVRQRVHGSSTYGEKLDFMAAVFMKDNQGNFIQREYDINDPYPHDPYIVSKTVEVQNNNLPNISWETAPDSLVTFYEDEQREDTFMFTFDDSGETPVGDLNVSATTSPAGIIQATTDNFQSFNNGQYATMDLKIEPFADVYTDGTPVQVTVTVEDSSVGQSSLSFEVEVTPVNDAPSFALSCDELLIDDQANNMACAVIPSSANNNNQIERFWSGYSIIEDFDPGAANEANQSVFEYEVRWPTDQSTDDPSGILQTSQNDLPAVLIDSNTGKVSVATVDGNFGEATVKIRVRDNGGTHNQYVCENPPGDPELGCDVSIWRTLTIVSQPFKYGVVGEVSGVQSGELKLNLAGIENGVQVNKITKVNLSNGQTFSFKTGENETDDQLLDLSSQYTVTIIGTPNAICNFDNGSDTGTISSTTSSNKVELTCTP